MILRGATPFGVNPPPGRGGRNRTTSRVVADAARSHISAEMPSPTLTDDDRADLARFLCEAIEADRPRAVNGRERC